MKKQHDIHVSSDRDRKRWKVSRGGKTLSFHRTQTTALKSATREALRLARTSMAQGKPERCVDVVTHGRNGRIRSKDSYGSETRVRDNEQ